MDARMQKRKTSLAGAATLFLQRNYYYYVNKKPLSSDASEQERRISQDNADAITLCSIHGAKGREWSIVFGVRFNEGD